MTFTLGIFDLFAYAIPGSLNLAFFTYLAVRLGWTDLGSARDPGLGLLIGLAIASYLLGHLSYPVSARLDRTVQRWRRTMDDARREFLARTPAAADRAFLRADGMLLLGAVELHDSGIATEIGRLRAIGLMVRNSGLPMALAFVAALVELAIGANRPLAAVCAVLFGLGTVGSMWQGQKLRHWANIRTLEVCFWLPDIDERLRSLAACGGAPTDSTTGADARSAAQPEGAEPDQVVDDR
jgi:hypothetical protein